MISLALPWPPSINHYYGRTPRGAVYIKQPGKDFREKVFYLCQPFRHAKIEGRVEMTVDCFPPDNRRIDLDNRLKAVQDSIQYAGLYSNDCQIDRLHVTRKNVVKGGKIEVHLVEIV